MTKQNRVFDDCLSVRNDTLFIEECSVASLSQEFGTPLFVSSESQIRTNIRRFQQSFGSNWPGRVSILPAIKAHNNLTIARILAAEAAGCDVYSEGELDAALAAGYPPDLISVNGGGKSEDHIRNCIAAGVRLTLDDTDELYLVEKIARAMQKKASIRFRLRPQAPGIFEASDFSPDMVPVDLAFQAYKSGIPSEHLPQLGRDALNMEWIDLVGLHMHLGRHHASRRVWQEIIADYAKLIIRLRDEWDGYIPKEVDVGGGFASPRDPFAKNLNRWDNVLFPLLWLLSISLKLIGNRLRYKMLSFIVTKVAKTPNQRQSPSIEEYATTITTALRHEFTKAGVDCSAIHLQVEPGRSMFGNTGIHLSRVIKTKHQTVPVPWNWILLDTTYFFLAGGVIEHNLHDFVIDGKVNHPATMTADICGRSCFADRLIPEVRTPAVKPGDLMAILDTGAYQECTAANINAMPRPAVVLVSGNQAECIKRAETLAEVFGRDQIPDRLRLRTGPVQGNIEQNS